MTQGVEGLDRLTRQNAEMVAVSARSSQTLVHQAGALTSSVATMRLRYGSADEAMAIVQRGLARLEQVGWGQAIDEFSDPYGSFLDRDMSLYLIDREGRLVAFSARPEWIGLTLHELPGVSSVMADHMLDAVLQAADQGGGWVEYDWININTGGPAHKTAYIVPLENGTLMGCSCYRSGFELRYHRCPHKPWPPEPSTGTPRSGSDDESRNRLAGFGYRDGACSSRLGRARFAYGLGMSAAGAGPLLEPARWISSPR